MLDRTINFGTVALRSDLVFGCLVHSENGWVPFSSGSPEEQAWVRQQVQGHPFEQMLSDTMREHVFGATA